MSWRVALLVVGLAAVGLVAFFLLARRKAPTDPLLAGVNGLVGAVSGWGDRLFGGVADVIHVPVRVANDVIGVGESIVKAPINLFKSIF